MKHVMMNLENGLSVKTALEDAEATRLGHELEKPRSERTTAFHAKSASGQWIADLTAVIFAQVEHVSPIEAVKPPGLVLAN